MSEKLQKVVDELSQLTVLEIAELFGGKGHDYAASSPIRKRKMNSLIDEILRK